MKNNESGSSANTIWIDHIPALYLTPDSRYSSPRLIITLPGLSGTKESMVKPVLQDIAAAGFIGLSFDPWQHGERGTENQQQISQRVFGSFRRHFWPILGNTVLDTLRVIDWAIETLHIVPPVYMVGTSMGGDIAVAAAGLGPPHRPCGDRSLYGRLAATRYAGKRRTHSSRKCRCLCPVFL